MTDRAPETSGGNAARSRFVLGNLCCESEAAIVHRRLEHVPGVEDVQINIVARQVTVSHDPLLASSADIADALNEADLDARPIASGTAGIESEDVRPPATLIAATALFVVSLGSYWLPVLEWSALAAIAVGIWPIARKAVVALRNRVLDMNVLMTIAIVGALVIGEWHEGAAAVVLLTLAEWLEDRSLGKARAAIAAVSNVAPDTAVLADGDREVPAADVPVGTLVAVKPGRRVPLDGIVTAGSSAVDESALTGESVPVAKAVGDGVAAGTVNGSAYLEVRTTATADDSSVARMARLVEEAQTSRSPTERFVDRFAAVYTPLVVVGAVLVFALPTLAGGDPSTWFYRALVLLVVACPCALVISTPVTVVSGLARAARGGVLIKGGTHLETLGRLHALAMDKTGTLTEGRFRVVDCLPVDGAVASAELHGLMAAVEARSGHPVAEALALHAASVTTGSAPSADVVPLDAVAAPGAYAAGVAGTATNAGVAGTAADSATATAADTAAAADLAATTDSAADVATATCSACACSSQGPAEAVAPAEVEIAELETLAGEGVAARVDGRHVQGGNHRLAERLGWHDDEEHAIYTEWSAQGKTVVYHGVDGGLASLHSLADLPRPEAAEAVAALHERGLALVMLTGDNAGSAEIVRQQLGLDAVRSELMPGDKVAAVEELRGEYGVIGMVGDGVNDAPALAASDVGVAMGVRGTAVAMETADVALMTDDLRRLADVVGLGRRALRVIKFNVAFAIVVKAIVLALTVTGHATLWMAVAADVGASLIVVLHGMTLLRYDMS